MTWEAIGFMVLFLLVCFGPFIYDYFYERGQLP